MVLLSELSVSGAALLNISAYWYMVNQDMAADRYPKTCPNYSAITLGSTLSVYIATRLMLEGESPQSVIPGFLVIVPVMGSVFTQGKKYVSEWYIRLFAMFTACSAFLLFTSFKGFGFLSEKAEQHPLDRELQVYHALFIFFSSWRLCTASMVLSFPVFKTKWGPILMGLKIAVLWVLFTATGTKVPLSPWGALDEILLERNSLLYLIWGVVTFIIVMDQIAAHLVSDIERKGEQDMVDWEHVKSWLFGLPTYLRNWSLHVLQTTLVSWLSTRRGEEDNALAKRQESEA